MAQQLDVKAVRPAYCVTSPEVLAEAARHVKEIASSNSGSGNGSDDLYNLLSSAAPHTTYAPFVSGWPSLLRPLSPALFDLPAMVQERYRSCQTMCFAGVFPQIRRAWASIDNSFYMWRYDRSGDVPVEYCGEEQAICAVGIVRPRAGVFLEAISHAIILCTTTEIVLLGVCPVRRAGAPFSAGSKGRPNIDGDSDPDMALQPLPMYTVPSDNVVVTSVATSDATGRIFMGGSDGHLYELVYAAAETWKRKRCQKVRLTGSLQQFLPSFVPALLGLGSSSALDRVVVDNERHILYTLSQASAIQVFDLGADGSSHPHKVGDIADFHSAAAASVNGRDVFRNAGEKKGAAIKYIAPIPTSESSKLHLLVVTCDGRRVYFTTQHLRSNYYGAYNSYGSASGSLQDLEAAKQRPVTLQAVFARAAVPHTGSSSTGRVSAADLGRPAGADVVTAHYASGTLVISESAGGDGRSTKLLLACRNTTLPPASVNVANTTSSSQHGLRELLAELDNFVPGETCAIESGPTESELGMESSKLIAPQDELYSQIFFKPPRFVLISTAGVLELEKRRPLEVLQQILEERSLEKLKHFFEAYGAPEAAAMCFIIASSPPGSVSAVAAREAAAALENVALVGEPRMPEDLTQLSSDTVRAPTSGGIYMGQAVNPNPEPSWSAAHKGLCLYIFRLLQPVWDQRVMVPSQGGDMLLHGRLSAETMKALTDKLRCLHAFLCDFLNKRQQRGYKARSVAVYTQTGLGALQDDGNAMQAAAKRQRLNDAAVQEDARTGRLCSLVSRAAEAITLLQLLAANNAHRISARLDDAARRTLRDMTLRDLVYEPDGEAIATKLISVIVTQHLDVNGASGGGPSTGVDEVSCLLQKNCPSFFKEDDRVFYQASAKLKQAESASSPSEREALAREAVSQLARVPLACNLEYLTSQLAFLRHYEGILNICLRAAAASDPGNFAFRPELGSEYTQARQRREAFYLHVVSTLRALNTPGVDPGALAAGAQADSKGLSPSERNAFKSAVLKAILSSSDTHFHEFLYGAMVDMGDAATLLSLNTPYVERYLADASGLSALLAGQVAKMHGSFYIGPLQPRQVQLAELLAKLFINRKRFREAAEVYAALAARLSGPGEEAVTIEERVSRLQSAVLQAKSAGDSSLLDMLDADSRLMRYQALISSRLKEFKSKHTEHADDVDRRLAELNSGLRDISELYNDYAQPFKMWDVCLHLVNFAGGAVDQALIRQLWDHHLLATCEASGATGVTAIAAAAAAVEDLGSQLFPNEVSFPLAHVMFRLHQMAAGLWPVPDASAPNGDASDSIVRSLHAACRGSYLAVQRAFELLLARRAQGVPEVDLSSVSIKTQLLRSLVQHCRIVQEEVTSAHTAPGFNNEATGAAQRQTGFLADLCDKCAMEARRLGTAESNAFALQFEKTKRSVEASMR